MTLCLAFVTVRAAGIGISEFIIANTDTLTDEDGDASDWIELHNDGSEPVNLQGWGLTDNHKNLFKWVFPAVELPADGYLVVFASGKNRTSSGAKLHTNFKISPNEELILTRPNNERASVFSPLPAIYRNVSYGVLPNGERGWFDKPTPGSANGQGYTDIAPEVIPSLPAGLYFDTIEVQLENDTTQGTIRYTLDGSVPNESSPLYTEPLTISKTTLLKCRSYAQDQLAGKVATFVYMIGNPELKSVTSDLPLIILDNFAKGQLQEKNKMNACMAVFEPVNDVASFTNAPTLMIPAIIHKRGSTSLDFAKYSLSVETENAYWEDEDVPLLGMPSESDWVFYAPCMYDNSMIRNQLMYNLSNQIGRYAPQTRECELYLNLEHHHIQPEDYFGIYIPMEKIKMSEKRVSYPKAVNGENEEPGITGSYLLKLDRIDLEGTRIGAGGTIVTWVYPDGDDIKRPSRKAQMDYVRNYLNEFYSVLKGEQSEKHYSDYLDVEAAIDHNLLNAFAFNIDALRLSTFFTKVQDGKIVFGPIWDFDRSLGSGDGHDKDPTVWNHPRRTDYFNYGWWYYLFRDIDFFQQYIDRWQELRQGALSQKRINAAFNYFCNRLQNAEKRDRDRWTSAVAGRFNDYNVIRIVNLTWIKNRLDFIDSQFVKQPEIVCNKVGQTGYYRMSSSNTGTSQLYYCSGTTDPRLPGGGISKTAQLFSDGLLVTNGTILTFRAYNEKHNPLHGETNAPPLVSYWSGPVQVKVGTQPPRLGITELMYSPELYDGDNSNDRDEYAWLEVTNLGEWPEEMEGYQFSEGISYTFPALRLEPKKSIVIARNPDLFATRYNTNEICVLGPFSSNLARKGETIRLDNRQGNTVCSVSYSNSWYPQTDRGGYTLEILDPQADFAGQAENWRSSSQKGGTPGWWTADGSPYIRFETIQMDEEQIYFEIVGPATCSVEASSDLLHWNEVPCSRQKSRLCVERGNENIFYRLRMDKPY